MKRKYIKIIIIVILLFSLSVSYSSQMILDSKSKTLKVFYTAEDKAGWNAILKGKVLSFSTRSIGKEDFNQTSQEKTRVTVRLYDKNGIFKGDTLYIINHRNLIVARFKALSIYSSKSFGYLLTGNGYFKLAAKDFRVVIRKRDSDKQYSYVYKSRGDYYRELGEIANAITQYEKALSIDKNNPEAHTALGYIYLDKKILSYAMKEFDQAYKHFNRIYDNEDKYELLSGLVKTRFIGAYESQLPPGHKVRNRYILEGIDYSLKALKLYRDSVDINYSLGYFYYNNPKPRDVKAKELMQKVIKLDNKRIGAYIVLARLYYKHNNYEKALAYAEKAVKLDPGNERAQDTYKKINKFKK